MINALFTLAVALALVGPVRAQPVSSQAALENPGAFEHEFAVSLFEFDACGDPLAGRMFRRVLAERFARCSFSSEARASYQQRTRAQQSKIHDWIESLIETRGGLPIQLEGMSMTCHAQQASDSYREFRGRLEQYAQGNLPAQAIIGAPCDAPDLAPDIAP